MSTPEDNKPASTGEHDSATWGAVLLSNEIKDRCQKAPLLIDPFEDNDDHLKPASYHLSIGSQVRIDEVDYTLSADNPVREIPPHGIAMISTLERLNIPNDLIARWNIKVKEVYYGLVWVGGPQVDPGYKGPLICPVFNLSTRPYKLEYGKPLFTIDFVKTTPFIAGKSKPLEDLGRDTGSIGALDKLRTQSAIKERLEKMEREVSKLRSEVRAFQVGVLGMISILFIVLALLFTFQLNDTIDLSAINSNDFDFSFVAIPLSCVAFVIAILAWFKRL